MEIRTENEANEMIVKALNNLDNLTEKFRFATDEARQSIAVAITFYAKALEIATDFKTEAVKAVTHEATIANSSDRVLARSDRSRNEMKTVGWKTRCSCGEVIETKNNSIKTHTAKVQRHLVKAGA